MPRLFQLMHACKDACLVARQEDQATISLWELALADYACESLTNLPSDVRELSEQIS